MGNYIEYVAIILHPFTNLEVEELEKHLLLNGYDFGIDRDRNVLFVYIEEVDYVETILRDQNIIYSVKRY